MCKERYVRICQNCKDIWIVEDNHKHVCGSCKHRALVDTDDSNYYYAKNFDPDNFKSYYTFPLYKYDCFDKVFFGNDNSAFDFALHLDENPVCNLSEESMQEILRILNDDTFVPTKEIDYEYDENLNTIRFKGKNFITIRGWGMLTSDNYDIGAYGLSVEKAKEIQTKFAAFILSKLTTKKYGIQS